MHFFHKCHAGWKGPSSSVFSLRQLMKCIDKKSGQKVFGLKIWYLQSIRVHWILFLLSHLVKILWLSLYFDLRTYLKLSYFFTVFIFAGNALQETRKWTSFKKKGNRFIWKSVEFYYSVMLCLTDWVMKQMSMSTQKSALPALLKSITCTNFLYVLYERAYLKKQSWYVFEKHFT